MQKLTKATLLVGAVALLPVTVNAVTLGDTVGTLTNLVNALIPLVLAVAVLLFFWGLAQYLLNASDPEARGKGINTMFMGIIVIFVMVSLWGIVRVLQETFKVDQSAPIVPAAIYR